MSIQPVGSRDPSYRDDDKQSSIADQPKTKEPDFSGSAYAHATLPTGLIASSRPTMATLQSDARDLDTKLGALRKHLQSPEIVAYAKSGAKLYAAFVNFNVTAGEVAKGVYEVAHGNPMGILEIAKASELPEKMKALLEAKREFEATNGHQTNEAFEKAIRDFSDVNASAAKLAFDAKRVSRWL